MIDLWGGTVDDETCTAIGHFTIIWAQFELYYFDNNFNAKNSKNIVISESESVKEELLRSIKKALAEYGKDSSQEGIDWLNKLSVRENESHYNQYILGFLNTDNQSKTEQIIACIYIAARIRNNLLHGLKDFNNLDKQTKIFKSLYLFLKELIENNVLWG